MDPFTGEIRMMANTYAPMDWAVCGGQTCYIQQQTMLFAVIGNRYGGDGQTNFKLPDLQGRTPIGAGQGNGLSAFTVGATGGTEAETITAGQMATHSHALQCYNSQGEKAPGNTTILARGYANTASSQVYKNRKLYDTVLTSPVPLDNRTLGYACSPGAHDNRQPYLVLNFYICLYGNFPIKPQ